MNARTELIEKINKSKPVISRMKSARSTINNCTKKKKRIYKLMIADAAPASIAVLMLADRLYRIIKQEQINDSAIPLAIACLLIAPMFYSVLSLIEIHKEISTAFDIVKMAKNDPLLDWLPMGYRNPVAFAHISNSIIEGKAATLTEAVVCFEKDHVSKFLTNLTGDLDMMLQLYNKNDEVIELIYITGDTHGEYEAFLNRIYQYPIRKEDTVIICGDFGFIWNSDPYRNYFLAKLTAEPFTIAFADGNHENFDLLETYPVVEWNGGKTHKIADNLYHLMRGQRFIIEDKRFFVMGGAYSIDKPMRTEGKSWWKAELPSNEDYRTANKTLNACAYQVDYVITHTIPQSAIHYLGRIPDRHDAELTGYFEWLYDELEFKKWFAGHFHVNKLIRDNLQILFDNVVLIE